MLETVYTVRKPIDEKLNVDKVVEDIRNGRVAIFEAKYSKTLDALPDACDTAIQQINDRMYAADFRDDYDDILCYGIAFFKKTLYGKEKIIIYWGVSSDASPSLFTGQSIWIVLFLFGGTQ